MKKRWTMIRTIALYCLLAVPAFAQWTQVSGPDIALQGPQFIAPSTSQLGEILFSYIHRAGNRFSEEFIGISISGGNFSGNRHIIETYECDALPLVCISDQWNQVAGRPWLKLPHDQFIVSLASVEEVLISYVQLANDIMFNEELIRITIGD